MQKILFIYSVRTEKWRTDNYVQITRKPHKGGLQKDGIKICIASLVVSSKVRHTNVNCTTNINEGMANKLVRTNHLTCI